MSKDNQGPNIPERLASIQDDNVRTAVQKLWLFETQKAQSRNMTYKEHYRSVLEDGAKKSSESDDS